MTTRSDRQALARSAPDLPPTLPPRTRGKPIPLSQHVEPHVEALFSDDAEFRAAASSVNTESSPAGRTCFDDSDMAEKVRAHAMTNGGNPHIINAVRGALSTAVKRCMTKRGVGRAMRIRAARNNLLGLHSAAPAE